MLTNRRTVIGALLGLVPFAVCGQDTSPAPLKVLFIGNSYTSVTPVSHRNPATPVFPLRSLRGRVRL